MEVSEIIEKLKNKDEQALGYLFENYGPALNGIIMRILISEKLAEEVLLKTFLKIWDKIDQYDVSKSTLFTWMSQIARNSAIDVKRLKSYQNLQKTDTFKTEAHNLESIKINTASIDTKKLLDELDNKHRVVIDAIYLKGYTQSQAAEALNIPLGTVKTRLRNGIFELRRILKDEKNLFLGASLLIILIIAYLCR